jgi:hypothetical protein
MSAHTVRTPLRLLLSSIRSTPADLLVRRNQPAPILPDSFHARGLVTSGPRCHASAIEIRQPVRRCCAPTKLVTRQIAQSAHPGATTTTRAQQVPRHAELHDVVAQQARVDATSPR